MDGCYKRMWKEIEKQGGEEGRRGGRRKEGVDEVVGDMREEEQGEGDGWLIRKCGSTKGRWGSRLVNQLVVRTKGNWGSRLVNQLVVRTKGKWGSRLVNQIVFRTKGKWGSRLVNQLVVRT